MTVLHVFEGPPQTRPPRTEVRRWRVAILADCLGVTATEVEAAWTSACEFCADEFHGRPRLSGPSGRRLSFSTSYTEGMAVLAVAPGNVRVGVDAVRADAVPDWSEVLGEICSPRECLEWSQRPVDERAPAGAVLFAAKEAVLKALGSGLAGPARSVEVCLPENVDSIDAVQLQVDGLEYPAHLTLQRARIAHVVIAELTIPHSAT